MRGFEGVATLSNTRGTMSDEVALRLQIRGTLAQRVEEICDQLQLTPEGFAEYALEQEVTRQEIHRIKDEITFQEINRHILGEGQTLNVPLAEEEEALPRLETCQMCMREFERPVEQVEGPMFCSDCLAMARGGDFSSL
jgi:predicted transcriptional regulator